MDVGGDLSDRSRRPDRDEGIAHSRADLGDAGGFVYGNADREGITFIDDCDRNHLAKPGTTPSAQPVTDYSSFTQTLDAAGFTVRGKANERRPVRGARPDNVYR